MKLALTRKGNETWLEAAVRYAKTEGLERDVIKWYYRYKDGGLTDEEAAYEALYEWDLLDLVDEGEF